jgi:nucleoside phosphorylase
MIKDKMKLLIFAHKGEASHFIDKLNFKPCEFIFHGLYTNDEDLLLLTGEGLQNATEKTAIVLAKYSERIESIINIGIAGSLNQEIQINDINFISNSFKETSKDIHPKKFSFKDIESEWKCVSALERVLDINYGKRLAIHADIVDRELWAIASCAKLFKLKVSAIKLISDDAISETEVDICHDIKKQAREMSERLFNFYSKTINLN